MFKNKILLRNYFILILICFLTFLLVLYIARWHDAYSEYQKETPVIRGTLNYEITAVELDHYLMENPTAVIYMCTSDSDSCRNFEKDFKKLIKKDNLQDSIIYLNLSGEDINAFVDSFNSKYKYKIKLTKNYPALVEINDGKVTSLIEGTEDEVLTIEKASHFIELNHIGEK